MGTIANPTSSISRNIFQDLSPLTSETLTHVKALWEKKVDDSLKPLERWGNPEKWVGIPKQQNPTISQNPSYLRIAKQKLDTLIGTRLSACAFVSVQDITAIVYFGTELFKIVGPALSVIASVSGVFTIIMGLVCIYKPFQIDVWTREEYRYFIDGALLLGIGIMMFVVACGGGSPIIAGILTTCLFLSCAITVFEAYDKTSRIYKKTTWYHQVDQKIITKIFKENTVLSDQNKVINAKSEMNTIINSFTLGKCDDKFKEIELSSIAPKEKAIKKLEIIKELISSIHDRILAQQLINLVIILASEKTTDQEKIVLIQNLMNNNKENQKLFERVQWLRFYQQIFGLISGIFGFSLISINFMPASIAPADKVVEILQQVSYFFAGLSTAIPLYLDLKTDTRYLANRTVAPPDPLKTTDLEMRKILERLTPEDDPKTSLKNWAESLKKRKALLGGLVGCITILTGFLYTKYTCQQLS